LDLLSSARRLWRRLGRRGRLLAGVGAAALVLVAVLAGPGAPRLEPGGPLPEVIGFYENGWSSLFHSSFASLRSHYRYLDTVLAFWYSVDGDGRVVARSPNPQVAAWVKRHHLRMGILVNNVAGPSGDDAGMLRTAAVRHRAAQALARVVRQGGYQEVNVDFELLPADVRDDLTRFVEDLRHALPAGVTLSVSVFPKVGVQASLNGAYAYPALARAADYLVVMLYDQHSSGGPPGPVSSYPWVVANMDWFLHTAKIPPSRLVLGAGVYGYDWPEGSTQAQELPLTAIVQLARHERARIRVDRASGNPYFTYTDASGHRHIVWFQDRATVAQRLRLARQLGLRGIAIWALGQETPGVWTVIEETVARAR
jgi:spore germination protein